MKNMTWNMPPNEVWDNQDKDVRLDILIQNGLSKEWVDKNWKDLSPIIQTKISKYLCS